MPLLLQKIDSSGGLYSIELKLSCWLRLNFRWRQHAMFHSTSKNLSAVICWVGEHQHQLAHQCSSCEKFAHTWSVKLNIMGIWEWGIYGLINWWDIHDFWVGHLWLKWVGQLWKTKYLSFEICSKNKCWSSGEYPFWSLHYHRFRSLWTPDL